MKELGQISKVYLALGVPTIPRYIVERRTEISFNRKAASKK